ncbi:hypothetical protein K9M79_04885 [Candidatus Woesearchaeota archaeon]|nr:hypothetical protein [Candidatus Woesearchaeota archaeon]
MLWIIILPIFFLGVLISYQDLNLGKIKNKHILSGLIYMFIMHISVPLYLYFTGSFNPILVLYILINFFISIIIGFGLWYAAIWTAGDGKLFILFSNTLSILTYDKIPLEYLISFSLIANIFIFGLIIMSFVLLSKKRHTKKIAIKVIKEILDHRQLLETTLKFISISWLIRALLNLLPIEHMNNGILLILTMITFMGYQKFEEKYRKISYSIIGISVVIRLLIDNSIFSLGFIYNILLFLLIWRLLKSFLEGTLSKLSFKIFSKTIHVNKLKEGMILNEVILEQNQSVEKKDFDKKDSDIESIIKGDYHYLKKPKTIFHFNEILKEESEGLTKDQIKQIRAIGFKRIKIAKTVPFAPIIFLGAVMTAFANGNLLIVISKLFM